MKFLLCHNHYQQPGGEDQSFADEARILESHGHRVLRYTVHNDAIHKMGRLQVAARTIWHRRVYRDLRKLMEEEKPAVVHFTNTFPLISPAAYYAAGASGVPVVQSLRNYRLLCPNALFLRDGKPCEECLGRKVTTPAIVHKCYRNNRAATAVVTGMLALHRAAGTWSRRVDLYITPSEFARRKFIEGGLASEQIAVKPNFINPDPGMGSGAGDYAIYVGRLSPEKGITTLLEAWVRHAPALRLMIVGDGPLAPEVRSAVAACPRIEWLGRKPVPEVLRLIGDARLLVFPSLAYETFGRTVIEAFAKGTPVLASDAGASAELVTPGITGEHFKAGDAMSLGSRVGALASTASRMRQAARDEYVRYYTADRNYEILMSLYGRAISRHQACETSQRAIEVLEP